MSSGRKPIRRRGLPPAIVFLTPAKTRCLTEVELARSPNEVAQHQSIVSLKNVAAGVTSHVLVREYTRAAVAWAADYRT